MIALRTMVVAVAIAAMLSSCVTRSFYTSETLARDGQPRILLMPPDVELSEVTAAGLLELNAQWTLAGRANVRQAVTAHLGSIKAAFVEYTEPAEDSPEYFTFVQLQKVHGAIGTTVVTHHFDADTRLPAKNGAFDWSLGPSAALLGRYAQADYALFTHLRDSYASRGRKTIRIITTALFGVMLKGGLQTGHASLVDLKTGEVVWMNFLRRDHGDLRTIQPATETVAMLLTDMPK